MDVGATVAERTAVAGDYYAALGRAFDEGWPATLQRFLGSREWTVGLALVHPDWIHELDLEPRSLTAVFGPRDFTDKPLANDRCESRLIWGYECPLPRDLQIDHLFPYALGGATLPGNRIHLCRNHNNLKGVDVHVYPWETVAERCGLWWPQVFEALRYRIKRAHPGMISTD